MVQSPLDPTTPKRRGDRRRDQSESLTKVVDPWRLDAPPRRGIPPELDPWPTIWVGSCPRIHDQTLLPDRWLADYFRTCVERDLRDVLRVLDLDAFERFVRLAAAGTGQESTLAALAEDAGITQPTAPSPFMASPCPPGSSSDRHEA